MTLFLTFLACLACLGDSSLLASARATTCSPGIGKALEYVRLRRIPTEWGQKASVRPDVALGRWALEFPLECYR